jgi:gluconate kinase
MLLILLGPKGSGKSFIGALLEERCGIRFVRVEPLWKAYFERCASSGTPPDIGVGIGEVHPVVRRALAEFRHVAVETTGASQPILADLLDLAPSDQTLIVRVQAPLDLCVARIASRDATAHIAVDEGMIRQVHALSEAVDIAPDLVILNVDVSADDLAREVEGGLRRAGLLGGTDPGMQG